MIQLSLSTGEPVVFKPAPVKTFRGLRLPGADLLQAAGHGFTVHLHRFSARLFQLYLFQIRCDTSQLFLLSHFSEGGLLHFEINLSGQLSIHQPGEEINLLLSGQYRFSQERNARLIIDAGQVCQFMRISLSPDLLRQTGLEEYVQSSKAEPLNESMHELIGHMLQNPYEPIFREAFYDNCIRELLFLHVVKPPYTAPGDLTPKDMAAVYEADHIIATNINRHYSLETLARLTGTNTQVLKRGFRQLFGMGTFERLQQRKMQTAKLLLETTDKQIQEVADIAGYETATGFINAFRKQFGMTPRDWRLKARGSR